MPKVTVLLPVYNGEEYLRETLQSLFTQSYADFELLIVDDGSTDNSMSIVQDFNDSRTRILTNPKRLKLSGALNYGLKNATGELIARMDADDIALSDRLGKQVRFMGDNRDIGLCGSWVEKFGTGKKTINKYPLLSEEIRSYSLFDCPFAHPSVIFRRDLFYENDLYFDGSFYPTEDYEVWSRAVDCFPCANIGEVLLNYRIHGKSMTCSDWPDMDRQGVRIAERLLKKLGMNTSEDEALRHRNIGRGESYRSKNLDELIEGESWLLNLSDVNQHTKRYDEDSFAKTLALIWFRLCFHGTHLGFGTLKRYRASNLIVADREKCQRMTILALAIAKNSFAGGTSENL